MRVERFSMDDNYITMTQSNYKKKKKTYYYTYYVNKHMENEIFK